VVDTLITQLLSDEAQKLIAEYAQLPAAQLMLQVHKYPHLPMVAIAQQIQAGQKAGQKLPSWQAQPHIIYPPGINWEQCSSEHTARFKASLLQGNVLIDLTGGFGVDCFYMGQSFAEVHYVEQEAALHPIVRHNYQVLAATHIHLHQAEASAFLQGFQGKADVVYLDPARRDEAQRRVFRLEDCSPSIGRLLPNIWKISDTILLKTAPMLDIQQALSELEAVSQIWVVAVGRECKEVLYLLQKNHREAPLIHAVQLSAQGSPQVLSASLEAESQAQVSYALPKRYLYEPHAALLKAGFFKFTAQHYGLQKLHQHSHLYTSEVLLPGFMGRVFEVLEIVKMDKKAWQALVPEKKIQVLVRNYPLSAAQILQKIGFKEGGNSVLVASTDLHQKPFALWARRVQ
jgi:hypothetical protein